IVEVKSHMFGVHKCHNSIQPKVLFYLFIRKEGLCDGPGIRQSRGLDQDIIKPISTLHQIGKNADQVATHGATKTPIVHLKDFFLRANNEFVVNSDLSEFVLYDGNAFSVIFRKDLVEQRGFSRAQKAGQNRYRYSYVIRSHKEFTGNAKHALRQIQTSL